MTKPFNKLSNLEILHKFLSGRHPKMSTTDELTLAYLINRISGNRADTNVGVDPEKFAAVMGRDVRTIRRYLKSLEHSGFITQRGTNQYRINPTVLLDTNPAPESTEGETKTMTMTMTMTSSDFQVWDHTTAAMQRVADIIGITDGTFQISVLTRLRHYLGKRFLPAADLVEHWRQSCQYAYDHGWLSDHDKQLKSAKADNRASRTQEQNAEHARKHAADLAAALAELQAELTGLPALPPGSGSPAGAYSGPPQIIPADLEEFAE